VIALLGMNGFVRDILIGIITQVQNNVKRLLYLFLTAFNIISCDVKVNDSDIFNGEIKTIDDTVKLTAELQPHEVILDGITYGFPAIYDSLMFFYVNKTTNMHYTVFNIKTGKHIGDFCPRGQGPDEMRVISPIHQFYKEEDELKTLLIAPYNSKLVIWNISKTLENNRTVWDFIPYDWRKYYAETPHNYVSRLNDEEFIGKVQTLCMNPDEYCTISTVPFYEKRNIYSGILTKKYTVFNQSLKQRNSDQLFDSHDCLKPDGSKIIQFMSYMQQINVIDIETGKVTGYRFKKSSDFSYLANFSEPFENLPTYFIRATSNDKYVYALCCNGTQVRNMKNADFVVYIFDWDCNLIKKVKLLKESFFTDFFVDETNKFLYTINLNDEGETICRYDLKSIEL
jgi:hypothetical protein